MLMPKRTKYRKQQKGRNRGKSFRGASLAFGNIGIKALEGLRIHAALDGARGAHHADPSVPGNGAGHPGRRADHAEDRDIHLCLDLLKGLGRGRVAGHHNGLDPLCL